MVHYLVRRLLETAPVLLLTSIAVFLIIHLVPGDPALLLAGSDPTPDEVAAVRGAMGLDQPLPVQYVKWISHVLGGDLGRSYFTHVAVRGLVMLRLPNTLELTVAGLLIAVCVAVPMGMLAAIRQRGAADAIVSLFTAVGIGVPNFWLGILLILLFALALGWLPPGGQTSFARDPAAAAQHLILPAITLGIPESAVLSRFVKAAVLDVQREAYVRTARAKGLAERAVLLRHIFRNTLIPLVTVFGIEFGRLLGGAVIIESVFAWPGVGRLMVEAINNRDYAVVQGGLLILVTIFVLLNLIIDVTYGMLDPQVRLT